MDCSHFSDINEYVTKSTFYVIIILEVFENYFLIIITAMLTHSTSKVVCPRHCPAITWGLHALILQALKRYLLNDRFPAIL